MSTPSSPDNNPNHPNHAAHPIRRGKTTFHNLKATPKVLRPVQPQHVYDSYNEDAHERPGREEKKNRRRTAPMDLADLGVYAFFGVLALGVVFYLVQGASTMQFETVGETRDEIVKKNEEARRINEQRAREAALRRPAEPPVRETPVIPPSRSVAPVTPEPAPVAQPRATTRLETDTFKLPPRPSPPGGISAGMLPESQKKTAPDAEKSNP